MGNGEMFVCYSSFPFVGLMCDRLSSDVRCMEHNRQYQVVSSLLP